jgi:hypothetical protein
LRKSPGEPEADKEDHILICLKQPAAKVSADRTGADDENSHAYACQSDASGSDGMVMSSP